MKKMLLSMLFLSMAACDGGFYAREDGGKGGGFIPHDLPAIVQGEVVFNLSTGVQTARSKHPLMYLMVNKAYAATQQAVASTTVTVTVSPGVTFNATFTPSPSVTVNHETGQVLLGTFTITALNDNSVRKCGNAPNSTGNQRCNRAYIRMFTSNNGLLGDGDQPDTAPVLARIVGGVLQNISPATSMSPALLKSANITNNRFRLSQLGTDLSYELYADFSDVGDGSYSTTVTLQYAINKE